MPFSVWSAIDWFRNNVVDLDPEQTKTARSSRDYLFNQIKQIGSNDPYFPRLYSAYLSYGSFARSTKIRPLDDIDILVPLNGYQTEANQSKSSPYTYWLKIKDKSAPLANFPDEYGYVNSVKVLNRFRDSLFRVSNYHKAEIHRNKQAVTLDLTSYPWVFDIVPAVPIGNNGTSYYLIPNGYGDWIRTDPRIDQNLITQSNNRLGGKLLPTIRVLKAWNKRIIKPVLPSYYFENLILRVFQQVWGITNYQTAIKYFFDSCPVYLASTISDPKNLGPNLDTDIPYETKQKASEAMQQAATYSGYSIMYENNKDDRTAIYWWKQVFGPEFPDYG